MNNNQKAIKSGFWYTLSSFVVRGIGMMTTPIFTRLLSTEEYGLYHNYSSWMAIITVFVTLNLEATLIRARYDYEDNFDGYILSMLGLSSVSALSWFILFNLFRNFFTQLFGMSILYIDLICITLLFSPFISMFLVREQYLFEYRKSVIVSLTVSLLTAITSITLVVILENKYLGRVLGSCIPTILIGTILAVFFFRAGKSTKVEYWKYALPICLPYIPHVLSLSILNSMDQIMITRICGSSSNAIYSLAYSCASIVTILVGSLNSAFAPWLGEKLHNKDYKEIKRVSGNYIIGFFALASFVILLAPEIVEIFGGDKYKEGIRVVSPVAAGIMLQFLYCMFVNIEQFEKKTIGMAIASVSAAGLNFGLNSFFIPQNGYIAASYTTFISYLWMLLVHMFLVSRYGYKNIYNKKIILAYISLSIAIMLFMTRLYYMTLIRYIIICIYVIAFVITFANKRQMIIDLFRKHQNKFFGG